MGEHPKMQTGNSKDDVPSVLTKDWIINNPKYKQLFSGSKKGTIGLER